MSFMGPFKPLPEGATSGFRIDACHDQIKPGDVVVTNYRGNPEGRFEVLSDTGTGMFMFRDPDGVERPMRPATILSGNARIIRAE
jgi:hypothetical protein